MGWGSETVLRAPAGVAMAMTHSGQTKVLRGLPGRVVTAHSFFLWSLGPSRSCELWLPLWESLSTHT